MSSTTIASPRVAATPLAGPRTRSARTAWRVGGLAALVKLATALPVLTRYGWDRDELYFLQASRHLSLGYVDFPLVTALVTRAVTDVAGPSLFALRLTGVLAGMGVVVLVAMCVVELGGGRRAQVLATGLFVSSPYGLSLGMLLHPTMFDALTWAAFLYLALRVLRRPEPRLWPALGLVAGIGLETKGTIAVLLGLFVLATAILRPEVLRDRRALVGLAIAAALWLPEIGWEIARGWPTVAFLPSQDAVTAAAASRPVYLLQQILFMGSSLALAGIGTRALWRRPALRPLAVLPPLVDLAFLAEHGRCYYALPALGLALAAGAVALEGWWPAGRRGRRRALAVALAALQLTSLGLGAVIVWPILPIGTMIRLGVWKPSFYDDEIGWPDLVADTARAWRAEPPAERAHTVILAANYGEAGALDLWGPRAGLPTALSGHLSFQYWHPRSMPERSLLTVGFSPGSLRDLCASFRIVGRVDNRWRLDNQERDQPIASCRLSRPLGEIWARRIATDHL